MLVSINWLKDFVEIDDKKQLADQLTNAGLEVDNVLDYKDQDTVIKTDITPNRGDWASVLGVAREIGAFNQKEVKLPIVKDKLKKEDKLKVEVKATDACPRYAVITLDKIEVGQSDKEISQRIDSCGQRPINSIVDVTNYTMFQIGQPIHAFDRAKIEGDTIIVRKAKKGEKISLIDGKVIELDPEDLVIADSKKPIALAGIMGGLDSEVSDKTKSIVIESAYFNPKIIRASAKRHNLHTEASYRFERGVDPAITKLGAQITAQLIDSKQDGKIFEIDNRKNETIEIKIDYQYINQRIGIDISDKQINDYLTRLGFGIKNNTATVPSWRFDVSANEDLAEEVARLYGYKNIPEQKLTKEEKKDQFSNWQKKEMIKDYFSSQGLVEVYNYSFLSKENAETLGLNTKNLPEVVKPIEEGIKYLRNTLINGLITAISRNPQEKTIEIFEIGNVFQGKEEATHLGIGLAGKCGKAEDIIKQFESEFKLTNLNWMTKEYSKDDLKKFKVKRQKVEIAEINLQEVLDQIKEPVDLSIMPKDGFQFTQISKYPAVNRDLAFIVDAETDAQAVKQTIQDQSNLIIRVELFDEFESDKFGENKKNLAFHLFFQSEEKTLTDEEVDNLIEEIIDGISSQFQATLRK